MGNCLLGGLGDEASSSSDGSGGGGSNSIIKVMTSNGGIMELNGAVTVGSITSEFFPGHAIFPTHDLFWRPLSPEEDLLPGHSYYLFPLNNADDNDNDNDNGKNKNHNKLIVREGHVRSKSIPVLSNNINVANANASAPYRMSLDCQGMLKRSYTEVLSSTTSSSSSSSSRNSRYKYSNVGNGNNNNKNMGFWKVKLVIRSEQLLEILSQEARTEELIESVRTVAKCGNPRINNNNNNNNGFSNISSDQWSLPASSSSSRSASTTTNCNQN